MALNKESRTINAGKNAVSALFNKFAILALTFISRRFFIQYIGVEYLGINGLFSNILTLLSMADLGLGTAMNVSLYKPIAENDTKKISALLNYYKKLYLFIALGVTIIGFALVPFLPYLVNMDSTIPYLEVYYMVFVLKSAISYLFVYKSSILRADQKTFRINKLQIYINAAKVVIQIIVVILLKNYFVFIILDVLAVLAENLIVSHIADKEYPFIKVKEELPKEDRKNVFSDTSSIFLYKIAWSLLNGTDNILMSIIVGTIFVGFYSNYFTITSNVEMVIALIFTSLTASIGNLVATADADRRYSTFKSMQMVSFWICGIVCVCLLFLIQDFIVIWVGEDLLLDDLTVVAIVLNVFFSTCMRPVWTFREGTGMYKQIRYIMFVTAILNLVLSIVLGYWLGISGILFATSISKISTYFWYEPNILFKNFFKRSVKEYYWEYVKNTVLLLLCCAACYFPMKYLSEINIFIWLLKALICCVVVCAVYFIRYHKTPEFANIKEKAVLLVKRKRK